MLTEIQKNSLRYLGVEGNHARWAYDDDNGTHEILCDESHDPRVEPDFTMTAAERARCAEAKVVADEAMAGFVEMLEEPFEVFTGDPARKNDEPYDNSLARSFASPVEARDAFAAKFDEYGGNVLIWGLKPTMTIMADRMGPAGELRLRFLCTALFRIC